MPNASAATRRRAKRMLNESRQQGILISSLRYQVGECSRPKKATRQLETQDVPSIVRALAASRAHNSSVQEFFNTPTILLSAVKVRWDEAIRWGISLAWNAIQRHSLQSLLLLPMSGEEEARVVGAGHVTVHGSDGAEPDGQPGPGTSHCLTLFPSLHKRIRLQNESQKSTSWRDFCAIPCRKFLVDSFPRYQDKWRADIGLRPGHH